MGVISKTKKFIKMSNYPSRRESSELEQYQGEYNQPQNGGISFFDGVKRIAFAAMAIGVWGISGLLYSAYQDNIEKWNNLAFCFAVVILITILFLFAGVCVVAWANYAGVSIIPVKDYQPMPSEHEWKQQQEEDNEDEEPPIFPRRLFAGKQSTPEFADAVIEFYDALKRRGEYKKTRFVESIYSGKAPLYFEKAGKILSDNGRDL